MINDVTCLPQHWRYDVRLSYPPRNHCMVTSLLMHSKFLEFFQKRLIGTKNAITRQIFIQFLRFQNKSRFPVIAELSVKTAFQKLFRVKRSISPKFCNLKSDPILLIYIASRRRRTRKYPPTVKLKYLFFTISILYFTLYFWIQY